MSCLTSIFENHFAKLSEFMKMIFSINVKKKSRGNLLILMCFGRIFLSFVSKMKLKWQFICRRNGVWLIRMNYEDFKKKQQLQKQKREIKN